LRALVAVVLVACASAAPPVIGHFERRAPPKPSWCEDVLANRLALAGPPIRALLAARPFDKDAVLAWLREQPCATRRIVATSGLDGLPEEYDAIAEIPLASGRTLRCVASLRDDPQRPTFALACAPKPTR
jgi:hypothetical protein